MARLRRVGCETLSVWHQTSPAATFPRSKKRITLLLAPDVAGELEGDIATSRSNKVWMDRRKKLNIWDCLPVKANNKSACLPNRIYYHQFGTGKGWTHLPSFDVMAAAAAASGLSLRSTLSFSQSGSIMFDTKNVRALEPVVDQFESVQLCSR